ncbi:MAG: glycosyltransferase family 39 protein [Prevotellaceae bacterium]|jgi:hypothetical protein|nr:glycosyltransferase family 39 protein [Prevotellaceae bacterium]
MNHLFIKKNATRFPPLFWAILGVWLAVNLLQSAFTGLSNDEAYYWMYAQYLDWGYFDHPPMVALFIKMGGLLFGGELGVRFVTALAGCVTLIFIWLMIDEKKPDKSKIRLFFSIAASIIMFQAYGFVTTPDVPLLLFTAMLFYAYKRFLKQDNFANTLFIAVAAAGLLYSKYQGGLVILLILLSNLKLLKNVKFWLAGILALLLFVPHIYWQISNDFPTFKFHLIDRSAGFKFRYITEFFLNQLVVFNPFILPVTIYFIFKNKMPGLFNRALIFLTVGFPFFFFFTAFRGHVEPHWTVAACIGMMVIYYKNVVDNEKWRKYTYRMFLPIMALLLVARVLLVCCELPGLDFYGQKEWAQKWQNKIGEEPAAFINSYQKPSVYRFYTGKPAFALDNVNYRQNQYDLWQFENDYFGQSAAIVLGSDIHFVKNLITVQRVKIDYTLPKRKFHKGEIVTVPISIFNPYNHPILFNNREFPIEINVVFAQRRNCTIVNTISQPELLRINPIDTENTIIRFEIIEDLKAGDYQLGISLRAGIIPEAFNSRFEKIEILE